MALMSSAALHAGAAVTYEYDKFSDTTMVVGREGEAERGRPNITIVGAFKGRTPTKQAPPLSVAYTFISDDWQYLRCYDVEFLADGKPVKTMRSNRTGRVGSGFVIESILVDVPAAGARSMARASAVDSQVCRTELPFGEADMRNLRDVLRALTPPR